MKLFIEEYAKIHEGKTVVVAAREWILRTHHASVMKDLKFLVKQGINAVLKHNIPDNLWNRRFIYENLNVIPQDNFSFSRVAIDTDFYQSTIAQATDVHKIVFLERQFLKSKEWQRIKTLSTAKIRARIEAGDSRELGIANTNFGGILLDICRRIEEGAVSRVHILPVGVDYRIKKELFSLHGTGTLIWNDFSNPAIGPCEEAEINILHEIIRSNAGSGFLKKRDPTYIAEHFGNFHIARIDGIPIGCVELIPLDDHTNELGALSVAQSFLSLKIGLSLVEYAERTTWLEGRQLISLTNNPKLQHMYESRGYTPSRDGEYAERRNRSPGVRLYKGNLQDPGVAMAP